MKAFELIIILSISVLFSSCESTDLNTNQLIGDWQLQSSKTVIKIKNETPIDLNIDLSGNKYIMGIMSDGTFAITMDDATKKKIENLNLDVQGTITGVSGTYQLKNDQLQFKFMSSNAKAQNQIYKIEFLDNNNFQLTITREIYLETLKEQITPQAEYFKALGTSTEEVMRQIETEILEYNVKVVYKRI